MEGPGYATAAVAHQAAGDATSAWQAYESARQRTGMHPLTAGVYHWSALAPLACGDLVAARQWADDVAAVTPGSFLSGALSTRARVALAQGDLQQAERDAHDALALAAELSLQLGVPGTLECLAELAADAGSRDEAARLLGAADAVSQRTGEVRFQTLDANHEAQIAKLRNDMGDKQFEEAWAEGAALSTDEAIAYAQRGRGERKRPSSGWAALTPSELDVVRLVSDGLANKDIATRLFISPRTVETHLTHVYAKLGLASRVQLAKEAARHA